MNAALFAGQIRQNILRAMHGAVEMQAELLRSETGDDPFAQAEAPALIGTVQGYRYVKRSDAVQLGLSGELADQFDTEWFIDFAQKIEIQCGDLLKFGENVRRVRSARGGVANIYKIYRLAKETSSGRDADGA